MAASVSPDPLAATETNTLMPKGNCSICGIFCDLTFEHIPPRSALNKRTKYQNIPFLEYVKLERPFEFKIKGKIEQGGVGEYCLCRSCNNFLGSKYVNAYSRYSNAFTDAAKKDHFNYFQLEMHEFETAKVLKQIISMFLCINGWDFTQHNPELTKYVLDPESQNLPDKFRIFNYLNTEGKFRNLPVSAIGNLTSKRTILVSEITFPPLGHVLTIDFTGTLQYHFELTDFKNESIDAKKTILFKMYRLPTFSPFPLDYRDKATILSDMSKVAPH